MMLSKEENNRYSRHYVMPEVGIKGQEKLKMARVLVIGAGGLGCPVLQYLCAAGVGHIGIVDGDIVSESNLQRQVLFSQDDIGKNKSETAAVKLQKQNPFIEINPFNYFITADNAVDIFSQYDIIADGTDTFEARYLINDACIIADKPLVAGSVLQFEGQLSVFNYKGGPTYRCLYPEPPSAGESPSCADAGVLGVLPGIVGCLQANEIIKIILDKGEILSGTLLHIDAFNLSFNQFDFKLDPENKKIQSLQSIDYSCISPLKEINATEFKKLDLQNYMLIDVREKQEYEQLNLGGFNIPLSIFASQIHSLDRDKQILLHCASGIRSKKAAELLIEKGFKNVTNLKASIYDLAE